MPRGRTLTRQWEKVEVMKRKTENLRTTMRMGSGVAEEYGEGVQTADRVSIIFDEGSGKHSQQFCVQERMTELRATISRWELRTGTLLDSVQLH